MLSSRQPPFALLLALAWALIAAQLLFQHWGQTAQTLNDTDDAMRLVEMRAFLAGQGWFDLHQGRVQPPIGLDSHWSRLIDAGLAGLFLLFSTVADAPLAERLMRALWPMLWLVPTLIGTAAIAWRIAGREAALIALLLAVIGLPAFNQFVPGRIDHHNVQIALAVLTVAATVWSDRVYWAASAAGALTGLALAIGFEGLPYVVMCGAVFAMRYVIDPGQATPLRHYGRSMAVSVIVAFGASLGHEQWLRSACDMIAFNIVLPAATAGLLLAACAQHVADSRAWRCGLVGIACAISFALFASTEPRCLAGPFAMMDPAIWPIWLSHVNEMQPLARLTRNDLVTGVWLAAFPSVALVAAAVLARDGATRRDAGFLIATLAFLLSVAIMLATVKGAPYAIWFGMPLAAALAVHLATALRLQSLLARFALGMVLTPTAIAGVAVSIAAAFGHDSPANREQAERRTCFETATYATLAKLPRGLAAANVDYGPFLLALTPHSVVAAPYHRLSVGIMAAHQIFAEPPEVARDLLVRFQASYVVTCGPQPPLGIDEVARKASLWGQLQAGHVPDWLEPVPETNGQPLRVYRFKHVMSADVPDHTGSLTSVAGRPSQTPRTRP
jgi:hypothetical protein